MSDGPAPTVWWRSFLPTLSPFSSYASFEVARSRRRQHDPQKFDGARAICPHYSHCASRLLPHFLDVPDLVQNRGGCLYRSTPFDLSADTGKLPECFAGVPLLRLPGQ